MTADARSLGVTVPDTFDFDSQAGILFVLRAVRAADISAEDKNKLKDLVFLYNTGGKDVSVKTKLADSLAALGVTPAAVLLEAPKPAVAAPQPSVPAGTTGFMGGRLTPVFNPPVTVPPSIPVSESKPVMPSVVVPVVTQAPVEQKIAPVVATPAVETVAPVAQHLVRPIVPVPRPVPKPEMMAESVVPEANNIEIVKKVTVQTPTETPALVSTPTSTVASASTPVPVPTAAPTEMTPEYVSARMERIRIIKSDINARVGNPVNLVDVDNALGRDYMSALLEAMKLLSSASEQESSVAMNRLEAVYTKVLALLESQQKPATPDPAPQVTVSDTPPTPTSVPVRAPVSTPVEVPQAVIPPVAPEVVMPVVPVATPAAVEVKPIVQPAEAMLVRSKVSDKPATISAPSNWETTTASTVDVVQSVGAVVVPQDAVTVARMSTPPAEPLRPVVSSVAPLAQPEITPSVGEVQPLRVITELPTAAEVSAIEAMSSNPLYTKDVDAGLDQLLSEWAIFKKSGLFGTGPKGREHPLYLKISPLQVPLILSGRFEGSTQEIKQSITDYMNGWRYEQGIIYEPNETFDQYLRRVIRHIIDLQKTKRRS